MDLRVGSMLAAAEQIANDLGTPGAIGWGYIRRNGAVRDYNSSPFSGGSSRTSRSIAVVDLKLAELVMTRVNNPTVATIATPYAIWEDEGRTKLAQKQKYDLRGLGADALQIFPAWAGGVAFEREIGEEFALAVEWSGIGQHQDAGLAATCAHLLEVPAKFSRNDRGVVTNLPGGQIIWDIRTPKPDRLHRLFDAITCERRDGLLWCVDGRDGNDWPKHLGFNVIPTASV